MNKAQELAMAAGFPIVPVIEWLDGTKNGVEADGSRFEDWMDAWGIIQGGPLDGYQVEKETNKFNCGAYRLDIMIWTPKMDECVYRYCNSMNGCWQQNHKRDESETAISPEILKIGHDFFRKENK